MARLTWRQRLIAIAVGAVVAALQAYVPAHTAQAAEHANAACVQAVSRC